MTGGDKGLQGLQGVTEGDKGLQRVTRGDRGLQGVTGAYKGYADLKVVSWFFIITKVAESLNS